MADGRVFTGRQAVALKLVDELGNERTAIAWLAKEKKIDPKTPVRDYRLRDRLQRPAVPAHRGDRGARGGRAWARWARRIEEWGAVQAIERLNLDGLLALWHPSRLRTDARTGIDPHRAWQQWDGSPMIKSELVQRIASQNPHLYQRDVENIVNAILGEIIAAMARGDRVELRGFGAFSVKHRPARTGRNPRTGAHVSVDQKSVPFFKTGKEMRERLNRPAS